ncbi:flagellar type III secretion system pore protein FliP [Paenarthrobacter sp. C1]|uniref:flagellar type III secretion system pore protein FliP n=1 Tax=Paenarthrobacter sp. C1 TaxID=3400220 RepID=UPI003BF60EF6
MNDLFGSGIQTVVTLGLISLAPFMLVMMTAFTRIVVVLGLTRSALNTPGIPPNPVIIGLALFLTAFVMAPTFADINTHALQPYLAGDIGHVGFFNRAIDPMREFMLAHTREKDLALFINLTDSPRPDTPADVATTTLVPAFVISELRTAFLIGFIIYIPFIVIDLVISSVLSAVGMVMLPPVLVSLPFKLLLFIVADGWYLIVQSLVTSYRT